MFRGVSKSPLIESNFSVGSTLRGGPNDTYFVVKVDDKTVHLVSGQTFQLIGKAVSVVDPNWLTTDEARAIASQVPGYAFSDFDCNAKGLKGMLNK